MYYCEILPLFLYVGEKRDACNAALNYDLKINTHVALGEDIAPAFPGKIESLHVTARDSQDSQLPFEEIYEFIGQLEWGLIRQKFVELCRGSVLCREVCPLLGVPYWVSFVQNTGVCMPEKATGIGYWTQKSSLQ